MQALLADTDRSVSRLLSDLPPGVVARVGGYLAAGDRAALARASRCFASVHHAVAEEDAWPHPERARPILSDDGSGRAQGRVALLVRALPGLRTLRVGASMHEEAREFLELAVSGNELGGGRTARFNFLFHTEERNAKVVRDFPGRTSAEVVHLNSSADHGMIELLGQLVSVDCLSIAQGYATYDANLVERSARQLVASIPWAAIRSVRLGCVPQAHAEAVALLALIPASVTVTLRVSVAVRNVLRDILAEVRAKPPEEARALLARLVDVEMDACDWSDESVVRVFEAVPVIASLPEACSISFVGPLCRNALAIPLVQEILAPDGGMRGLVRIVCEDRQWWTGGSASSVSPFVQAVVACVAEPRRLRTVDARGRALECSPRCGPGGIEAALERLRGDPHTAGATALWRRMARLGAREADRMRFF